MRTFYLRIFLFANVRKICQKDQFSSQNVFLSDNTLFKMVGANFTNILPADFLCKRVLRSFSLFTVWLISSTFYAHIFRT